MSITRIGNYSQLRGNPMKIPCIAATTAGITLSGFQTIDGVGVTGGDRVLVKNQSTSSENGIYIVQSSDWYRAADMSSNDDVYEGVLVLINQGSTYADQIYYLNTPNPIVLGSTSLTFTVFPTGGTGGSSSLTIGTTPIASGTAGRLLFEGSGNVLQESSNARFDGSLMAIGGATAAANRLTVHGLGTTSSTFALRAQNSSNTFYMQYRDDGQFQIYNSDTATTGIWNGYDLTVFRLGRSGQGLINFDGEFAMRDETNATNFIIASSTSRFTKGLGINTSGANNSSAALQVESTTQGFLMPRMSTTQRNSISTPATGLAIWNFTTDSINVYQQTGGWTSLSGSAGATGAAGPTGNSNYSMTIQYPTASENQTFFFTDSAFTISALYDVVRGSSPSVTYQISYNADRSSGTPTNLFTASRTTTSATGASTTTFANPNIPANNWVWVTTSASASGTTEINITIKKA